MAFELETLREHNSSLLDLLTQHLPDMLWVKDIDGIYLYANQAICDGLLMAKDTKEPIGKGDVFFALREREAHKDKPDWHTFGELCFNSDFDVIEQNRAMKFEEYGNVKGELLYLEVYKAPFYDKDGKVIGTVGAGRDITKLKKTQFDLENSLEELAKQKEKLLYQASHDTLTGLPNRTYFIDILTHATSLAKCHQDRVAVLFIDLDNFKEINDSLGHIIGDKVLVEYKSRIRKKIRDSDTLARLGGDEFGIILNDVDDNACIVKLIDDLMMIVKEPFTVGNNILYITTSIGISMYPNDGEDSDTLLKNSDAALYKSKENGRNTYCFYDEKLTKKATDRVFLETELRKALQTDQFEVYYQPQMNGISNRVVGMEALVRWNHPTLGFIYPDRFIPLAEVTGMIIELDRIVMKKAFAQLKAWYKEDLNPGKLSLNLSVKQLEDDDFIEVLRSFQESKECSYSNLEFEVTESQIMSNPDKSIQILEEISAMGISIAIDDFGTGYSSLAYLKRLPIDKLKIDKSFIDNLPQDAEDSGISKTIISLCKTLNLKVIAEGVETIEQKEFLLENNCKFIQGYLYSKPLNAQDMREFIIENTKG
ncbi:MAG: EAL domain-containing protein [Campylobacterota bacterium]|nr:EAL domain-containing protein [Campylobacterota bacterium]